MVSVLSVVSHSNSRTDVCIKIVEKSRIYVVVCGSIDDVLISSFGVTVGFVLVSIDDIAASSQALVKSWSRSTAMLW